MAGAGQHTMTIELPRDVSERLQRIVRRRKWTIAQHIEALLVLEARIAERNGVETLEEVFKKRVNEARESVERIASR